MSDLASVLPATAQYRVKTVVARASGSPITSGTVNHYLLALTGANAGKWWKAADNTWAVAETATAMSHQADGNWSILIAAGAWIDAVEYLEYVKESGDLHIPDGLHLVARYPAHTSDGTQFAGASIVTIAADVANMDGAWTATRAGYVDNLSAGAVALEATLAAIKGAGWTTETLAAIDVLIDAIKAKTDLLPASPAAVGSAMTLTTGERTSIATAVWISATRTLTSFSTLVTDIAAGVWAYATRTLTQSAAQVTAAVAGSTLTILRGDSWTATLTGLGNISTRTKLWFTAKTATNLADSAASIQIRETTGLLVLNGSSNGITAGWGAITVNDATTGSITITLDEAATTLLSPASGLSYDVQMLTSGGAVQTLTQGSCNITADTTRAIS